MEKPDGIALIINDDQWWVIECWIDGVCLVKLLEKDEYPLRAAVNWMEHWLAQHTTIMSDDLEVDPDAELSLADDGAWVQCWVYDSECEDHG